MSDPLLLLPDMMCDARVFGPQIAELSAEVAVMVAPVSADETIAGLARQVLANAPARFALLGQGLGGAVALAILRQAPEQVTRFALVSGSPLQDLPFDSMFYETLLLKTRAGRLQEAMEDLYAERLAETPFLKEVHALLMEMAETLGPEVFTRQVRALQRRGDMQSVLRKYTGPALVIGGSEDMRISGKRHQTVAEFLPDGQFQQIEGAGAFPSLEQPEAFSRALKQWLARPLVLRA